RKGNCWDNAPMESFFKSMKSEWIYHHEYIDRPQASVAVFEYIESWYNRKRLHSALGYLTPAQYEKLLLDRAA
ncbi:IS3 family transposase, partial [Olivibacter sitiensis]